MADKEQHNTTQGQKLDAFCNTCNHENEHEVVMSLDTHGDEMVELGDDIPPISIQWANHYQIISCGGCKTVSFRHGRWFSEDMAEDCDGRSTLLYPVRVKDKLVAKEYRNAPPHVRRIYRETIEAFNSEGLTLCAGGLRAIVEGMCATHRVKKGPVKVKTKAGWVVKREGNLRGKISGLQEKGLITKRNAETLHSHRFLGNDALHDLEMPSVAELKLAIEIIEHTLAGIYEMTELHREIKWRRKERQTGRSASLVDRLGGRRRRTK